MEIKADFLVIGSGIAGLTLALKAAEFGRVVIVTKRNISESNTMYAQGGIASVWSSEDTFEKHINDTLIAGDGLCNRNIVEMTVRQGPDRIKELIEMGVGFTYRPDGLNEFDLAREGGHSKRRILHADDLTGQEVEKALIKRVKENPGIRVFEYFMAVNLIMIRKKCYGAYVLDTKKGSVETFIAGATILATGGAGKVYLYTSNSDIATGDGIAMAYRAGAEIANMEFIQFHPTCLYHPLAKSFLISEAVRGEGGILRLKNGRAFMKDYNPMADLAPRDIVARAIDSEMKKTGDECVFLDISYKDKKFIMKRFPNIYSTCCSFGFDMAKEPVPVVPAAHYTCGGISVDKYARTTIKNLYAIGEVACTGLHGANRLASNSLLEALAFSHMAAKQLIKSAGSREKYPVIQPWDKGYAVESYESVVVSHCWEEIRRIMTNYVGIVRSRKRLDRARKRMKILYDEIEKYYWEYNLTGDLIELRNLMTVARLIIESAIKRRESRGLHYIVDYPNKSWRKKNTIMKRKFKK